MLQVSAKTASFKNLIILNLAVVLMSFTGILGALISMSSTHLVWYRLVIGVITLYGYLKLTRTRLRIGRPALLHLFFTGAILAAFWLSFFASIKAATVSITLVCFSALTLFTALLEPLFKRRRISSLEVGIGLLIMAGIYLIFKFENRYVWGTMLGLLSAFCGALFNIVNGKLVNKNEATVICFYEILSAWLWVSVYLLVTGGFNAGLALSFSDLFYLFILGTLCTGVAYVANIWVMKELSAFQVALVTNLEPIYGVLMAVFIFGSKEQMSGGFYAGALIMLGAVFLYPVLKKQLKRREKLKGSLVTVK
ncbi:permease [Adhaeribacter aerolatus]|uniref:Permease n=1 Tax=Adhaeribacter aerolatus TaxID=670289 RepID=A0A512ASI3_9BACT|nr:DMT family transporter [Adhaeribacter aerolatus]GEO02661.1 permease [Adhaeribacter aerolatus]